MCGLCAGQIDDLRRERVLFDTIYKKMERELSDRKKMMANVIEVRERFIKNGDKLTKRNSM